MEDVKRTRVMGIVNVTPDSFFDGGRHYAVDAAVRHAEALVAEGADIIDIGGESTRPGSQPVSEEEELRRVIPVLRGCLPGFPVPVSIDTYKPEVAREALEMGVQMINDITGFQGDPRMPEVVARHPDVSVVLMHMQGRPRMMQDHPAYADVVGDIRAFLERSLKIAGEHAIAKERCTIDPGLGFGKTADHNREILRRLSEFMVLGVPILVGPSRKSFIGKDHFEGTAAAVAIAVWNGASIVRVHDVKAVRRVVQMVDALRGVEYTSSALPCS